MLVELKAGVVHPDRATAADGHVDQPLPQSGNRGQPLLQGRGQSRGVELVPDLEQKTAPTCIGGSTRSETSDMTSSALARSIT